MEDIGFVTPPGATGPICQKCGRVCKNDLGLKVHLATTHRAARTRPPLAAGPEGGINVPPLVEQKPKAPGEKVLFRSPKAAELQVIIKPSYFQFVDTPGGKMGMVIPGKVAAFKEGMFVTDDPEIIAVLSTYKDDRYPIYSQKELMGYASKGN